MNNKYKIRDQIYDSSDARVSAVSWADRYKVIVESNGRKVALFMASGVSEVWICHQGRTWRAEPAKTTKKRSHGHQADTLSAPMPGVVTEVLVSLGDEVHARQRLVVLEAMKMEQPLVAPHDGKVTSIKCTVGQVVKEGEILVEVETI